MLHLAGRVIGAALLATGPAIAQTAPGLAPYVFEQGFPGPGTSQRARDDADFQRAMIAYRFWYPTVSVEGIFNGKRWRRPQECRNDSRASVGRSRSLRHQDWSNSSRATRQAR